MAGKLGSQLVASYPQESTHVAKLLSHFVHAYIAFSIHTQFRAPSLGKWRCLQWTGSSYVHEQLDNTLPPDMPTDQPNKGSSSI